MADKADKIMDAAIDKFAEKGYYNTKIADIVEAVGIAKGTFYLYFNSKKDLMLELIRRHRSMLKKVLILMNAISKKMMLSCSLKISLNVF